MVPVGCLPVAGGRERAIAELEKDRMTVETKVKRAIF